MVEAVIGNEERSLSARRLGSRYSRGVPCGRRSSSAVPLSGMGRRNSTAPAKRAPSPERAGSSSPAGYHPKVEEGGPILFPARLCRCSPPAHLSRGERVPQVRNTSHRMTGPGESPVVIWGEKAEEHL